tara:strand:+ start:349 stop:489 length:141 start_codon:yes stop_codon:yes gene_type:complete
MTQQAPPVMQQAPPAMQQAPPAMQEAPPVNPGQALAPGQFQTPGAP